MRLSTWFRHSGKDGQFEKESDFLYRSERIGVVALVMREAGTAESSQRYGAYFIPWNVVSVIGTRVINTVVLDSYAADGFIYKLPTEDGTVCIPPGDDVFRRMAEMDKRAEELFQK